LAGYAKYSSKHGRIEDAIILYQKAMKECSQGGL